MLSAAYVPSPLVPRDPLSRADRIAKRIALGRSNLNRTGCLLRPRHPAPARRAGGLPVWEGRVRLVRRIGLFFNTRAAIPGDLRLRIDDPALEVASAGHEDHAGAISGAHEDVMC